MSPPPASIDWRSIGRVAVVALVLLNVGAGIRELLPPAGSSHVRGSARLARDLVVPPPRADIVPAPSVEVMPAPSVVVVGPTAASPFNESEVSVACRGRRLKEYPECPVEPAELLLRSNAAQLAQVQGSTCKTCGIGRRGANCCRRGGSWFGLCGRHGPYSFRDGFRACNELSCPVCGRVRAGNGDIDINCCHRGGSWAGRCGPPAQGWPFTWKDGFRLCNNMSLTPEPVRLHDGPFLPLYPARRGGTAGADADTAEAVRRRPLLLRPSEGGLKVYYISLKPLPMAQAKLARLLGDRVPASRQAVVQGVPAAEALSTAGVPPEAVEAVFGEQAREPEFLAALGCTMSHLLTARRALAEGADPALVLEEDAVLDLEPFWQVRHLDSLVDALPAHWQAVQLSILATTDEWSELRLGWQRALETWKTAAMLKSDYFWSTAAYLMHPRGMRALAQRYQPSANQTNRRPAWQLGSATVRCVKADTCVLYPALAAPAVYTAVPPMFVAAERVRSNIDGHDQGQQREVHVMSRMQALDLAAEAFRERIQRGRVLPVCASRLASETSKEPQRYVFRRPGSASAVLELRRPGTLAQFSRRRGLFSPVGTWHALGPSLLLARHQREPQVFCREAASAGDYAAAPNATSHSASRSRLHLLAPPVGDRARSATTLPFKFWLHDGMGMDWLDLLPCLPDWDTGMDSQNSAEVWLLRQLQAHPNRTQNWRDANVVVLPLLLKTSLQAAACANSTHRSRLSTAIAAMRLHPAYRRSQGHDHLALFNYWDAWSAIGPRGSAAYHAFENISLGWHETYDAAWGMANHRYVGKCQVSLPYVEPPQCAAQSEKALLGVNRTASLFFAGARSDFDTASGCPNVLNHSIQVRHALFGLRNVVPDAVLRQTAHNMRQCNESSACEADFKQRSAEDMMRSRYCAVAAGDTPTTGRLFDAISCLCVPIILADDLQLPFPVTRPVPEAAFGVRVPEASFRSAPSDAVGLVLARTDWATLQRGLLRARRALAYRTAGSNVAALALREAWATCLRQDRSRARPPSQVAKC